MTQSSDLSDNRDMFKPLLAEFIAKNGLETLIVLW